MNKLTVFAFGVLIILFHSGWRPITTSNKTLYQLQGKAQGTTYTIKYIAKQPLFTSTAVDSLFSVFDYSLSRYKPTSLISILNKSKKIATIDIHLQQVLQGALKYQELTNGCFDYRLLPLQRLWGFESNHSMVEPNPKYIEQTLKKVRYNKIKINELHAYKSSKNLEIDLDGIAQGYCVDQLAHFLQTKGIDDYIIELGGEIAVSGKDMNNDNWTIGISDASYVDDTFSNVQIQREGKYAVTSSGSFQQYRKVGNKLVSHIIDPRTGYPVQHGVISVTVMAPTAIEADALDNAFMVMGIKETFEWLKIYPNIGVYMSYIDKNGEKADTANSYFKQYMVSRKSD